MMKFFLILLMAMLAASDTKTCAGCTCDCSWAKPSTCGKDDGSCCWSCCCHDDPGPEPPAPTGTAYCPSAQDLVVAYNNTHQNPIIMNQGWIIQAGGAVATKSAFNMLGGYVEYDVDFAGVPTGVNANIYTISPKDIGSGFDQSKYCDGAATGERWCIEVDWIESNGNCGGATTLHTKEGPGNDGCTAWGCRNSYHYNGRASFHMRVDFDTNGKWTTTRDGQTISPSDLNPTPGTSEWNTVQSVFSNSGAVIYSSQWVGWVPVDDCGTKGDLGAATYKVSNLKIVGSVSQGPEPTKCN